MLMLKLLAEIGRRQNRVIKTTYMIAADATEKRHFQVLLHVISLKSNNLLLEPIVQMVIRLHLMTRTSCTIRAK